MSQRGTVCELAGDQDKRAIRGRCAPRLDLIHQFLQSFNIPAVVAGPRDRSLGDEGGVRQAEIVEQDAKRLFADSSLSDLFVTVELRSTRGLGVIAMNDFHIVQANACVEM